MLIGELSKNSGVSTDTIRWYEKIGLFSNKNSSRDSNNYRIYDHEDLDKLILIKQSKLFGFMLKEIKEMLELIDAEDLNCGTVSPIVDSKLNVIDQKISSLQSIRTRLIKLKEQCSGDCEAEIMRNASNK